MVVSPVLRICEIPVRFDPSAFSALIFASQHAVSAVAHIENLSGQHAFAVGSQTGRAARDHGMSVICADGDADGLVEVIINTGRPGPFLFLRGRHSTGNIQLRLKERGLETESMVVYEQKARPLTQPTIDLLCGDTPVVLPLFSPRSASILASEANRIKATAPLILVGISPATLAAWDGPTPQHIIASKEPSAKAVATDIIRIIDCPP